MNEVLAPLESEFVEENRQHLEVVVLLVAHNIDHLVDWEVLETELSSTDVLSHINRSAVAAEEEFLVQSLSLEVSPNRVVVAAVEEAFLQSFHHLLATFKISI